MIYIRSNTDGHINIISYIPISNYTLIVDNIPSDLMKYIGFNKYLAFSEGLVVKSGWSDTDIPEDYFANPENYEIVNGLPINKETVNNKPIDGISMTQGCLLLLELGLYQDVLNIINSDTTGKSQIIWNTSPSWSRSSNMIKQFAIALNYTEKMMDDFFINAAKIQI